MADTVTDLSGIIIIIMWGNQLLLMGDKLESSESCTLLPQTGIRITGLLEESRQRQGGATDLA